MADVLMKSSYVVRWTSRCSQVIGTVLQLLCLYLAGGIPTPIHRQISPKTYEIDLKFYIYIKCISCMAEIYFLPFSVTKKKIKIPRSIFTIKLETICILLRTFIQNFINKCHRKTIFKNWYHPKNDNKN